MRIPVIKNHLPAFIVDYNLVPVIKGIQVKNNKEKNCKDGYSDGFEVNVLHCIPGFYNEDKIFLLNPCKSKILFIFVVTNSINGRHHCPKNVGLFLCPAQYGSGVLLSEGESPHSPVEGLVSRKGTAAFYLVPKLKIDAMTSISTRATGTSPAISAKSITYSSTLTGDMTISRRELYCSNLSYQNQLNQDEERRVS